MSELRRTQEADLTVVQDSINRNEGGMSPKESGEALPQQVAEIMRNMGVPEEPMLMDPLAYLDNAFGEELPRSAPRQDQEGEQ